MRGGFGILAALAVWGALGNGAQAQTPPEGLTWIALRDVNEARSNDREPTNRPPVAWAVPEGMIRAVDVSHDGVPDWLMDYAHEGTGQFCGTGGCLKRLYVSRDGELLAAFDRQASELAFSERDGERVIEAEVHHQNCAVGAASCRFAWSWNADAGRLVERIPSSGETRLIDGGFQPLEPEQGREADHLPAALSREWFGGRLTCSSHADDGFEVFRPDIVSIPDVTGDGVRDWMMVPVAPCDAEAPLPGFSIWATDGQGDAREAHVSAYGVIGLIDIAATPAMVIEQRGCGYEPECVRNTLRWNAAAGRFDPAR